MLYILLFPLIMCSQKTVNQPILNSKYLSFSTDFGLKFYTGNLFLEQQNFSREGVFINFNVFYTKEITTSTYLIAKSSLILSNAISKKIQVLSNFNEPESGTYFTTRIPNILSCNINFSFEINKKMNYFLSHSAIISFRLYPLFYKKGAIFGSEINALGGLISSEENGSLPSLEKASTFSYAINYLLNNKSTIKLLIFLNSDWGINSSSVFNAYPGFAIKFEKLLNLNR